MYPVRLAYSNATRQELTRDEAEARREDASKTSAILPVEASCEEDDGYSDLPCTD
jgi:hypothetical protein